MAESKIQVQAEIRLILTVEEALWLKQNVQNAHMRESPHDSHMRECVWNGLPDLQELEHLRKQELGR